MGWAPDVVYGSAASPRKAIYVHVFQSVEMIFDNGRADIYVFNNVRARTPGRLRFYRILVYCSFRITCGGGVQLYALCRMNRFVLLPSFSPRPSTYAVYYTLGNLYYYAHGQHPSTYGVVSYVITMRFLRNCTAYGFQVVLLFNCDSMTKLLVVTDGTYSVEWLENTVKAVITFSRRCIITVGTHRWNAS